MTRTIALPFLLVCCVLGASVAAALDPPHDASTSLDCGSCHITHHAPGGAITKVAGNANLCMSCHTDGGLASAKPFADTDEAIRGVSGTSHRWDSGVSGWVQIGAANASTGTVESGGSFTGRYDKIYTITITMAGEVGSAQFEWTTAGPAAGAGATNVVTGVDVALDEGISVTFSNGASAPSFQLNDQWVIYATSDINQPTIAAVAVRLASGKITCSACHNEHSQVAAPFDPSAPAYPGSGGGEGRHNQRVDNDLNQMCTDCHNAHDVSTAAQGSHPIGVVIPAGEYKPPTVLPLDHGGAMRCLSCHTVHNSPVGDGSLLRTDVNSLCTDCHTLADTASPAAHLDQSAGPLWPGPQYGTLFPQVTDIARRGACTNCHQPHGWPDQTNPAQDFPILLVNQEENLCYACHDGDSSAKNVMLQFTKTYRHPAPDYGGRHSSTEDTSASFGTSNRHAECSDCHNPHMAKTDASPPSAPAAPASLAGVSRVSVTNGAAGTVPTYTYREATDTTPATEYELCFKCHSSWTTQPAGQTNMAIKFNPNNASFHPVEAIGNNTNIRANSFVNGWTATSTMYCTDCHTSDDPTVRGPHGAQYPYLLKRLSIASSSVRRMASTEQCFDCHRFATYGTTQSSDTVLAYSRFNRPGSFEEGHAYHVDEKRAPCYACHDTHGSSNRPHMIVTGRNPGLNAYTETATGGTCSPTCHGSENYTINYPR